jgi:hypothetical protein
MLAEKIQTIYERGFFNSRSKDYYDLYILYKLRKELDIPTLIKACKRTFEYRKTEFELMKISKLLEELRTDETFLKRWKSYSQKNIYVKGITFDEVIGSALCLIKDMIKLT